MDKYQQRNGWKWLGLFSFILLSFSGCMLRLEEQGSDWIDRTVYLVLDFFLLTLLFLGLFGFLAGLFLKKGEDKKTLLTIWPMVAVFSMLCYLFAYWGRLFSGDFYLSYLQLLIAFSRPVYSVFIFFSPVAALLIQVRLIRNMTEEKRKRAKTPAENLKARYKKTKKYSIPRPSRESLPDYFNSFDHLYSALSRVNRDQKVELDKGFSFYLRSAKSETKEIPVFQNGTSQVLRQDMSYAILMAGSEEEAKILLRMLPFTFRDFEYVIVETPQGNWGKDKNGIYEEG